MTLSHTMIYWFLIIVTPTERWFFSSYFYLLPALLPHAAPPSPTLLHTESWMKEDVQEKIKHKQDQLAHRGFMRVKYKKNLLQRIWTRDGQWKYCYCTFFIQILHKYVPLIFNSHKTTMSQLILFVFYFLLYIFLHPGLSTEESGGWRDQQEEGALKEDNRRKRPISLLELI